MVITVINCYDHSTANLSQCYTELEVERLECSIHTQYMHNTMIIRILLQVRIIIQSVKNCLLSRTFPTGAD